MDIHQKYEESTPLKSSNGEISMLLCSNGGLPSQKRLIYKYTNNVVTMCILVFCKFFTLIKSKNEGFLFL